MVFDKAIERLNKKLESLKNADSKVKQHQKGKLTAKERLDLLLDTDSFVELNPFVETRFTDLGLSDKRVAGDGVMTGFGKIDGRKVFVYSQDFTKIGGSLGEMHAKKIVKTIKLAQTTGVPIIGIIDSGGARIQEGVSSLDGYAKIFNCMIESSGIIPQISIILGPSAGGASYSPGLSDFVFMVRKISQMYITGPKVVEKVTGEKVSLEGLGGADIHASDSGCSQFVFDSENDCFAGVRKLLSYLPQNNMQAAPSEKDILTDLFEKTENFQLLDIVPEQEEKSYDMKEVIKEIVDRSSFFEISESFAANSIVGLARLNGTVVGMVANQPKFMAGTLDINSSDKIARFVRFCDAFNIPLINLVDTPGYLPGIEQEKKGIIRHGAKVLYAFAEATVPKISLILRKAFGGAYIALASKKLGYDMVIAWPIAQISVMGPEQAVKIIYKKDLSEARDPESLEREKVKELKESLLDPLQAAKLGQIDMIIHPKDTRAILIKSLGSLMTKRASKIPRKHGNIPL